MPRQNANIGAVLAFDVGLKRTGVAVGHTLTRTVQPVGNLAVKNGRFPWAEIKSLIEEWQPIRCVIGEPGTDDPHLNKAIRRLAHHLQEAHRLPIVYVDETLSSVEANQSLDGSGLSIEKKTKLRDQLAACVILDRYMQTLD